MLPVETTPSGETKSLGDQLVQELMLLGGAEMPLRVQVSAEGRVATVTFSQWSPIAVGVDAIQIEGGPPQDSLKEFAAALAQKLSYLNEPIRVFEIDTLSAEAQLRSAPPKTRGDGVEYFEVKIENSGAIWLHRYRTTSAGPRTTTSFTLTLETLGRVVDDLSAT